MVIIGKDKNIDNDYSNNIKDLCQLNRIKFVLKEDLDSSIIETDLSIAISWKWMIKLNNPLFVLHDSILPEYRGHLPLVSQLIDGRQEIGVTTILANKNYDEGDILFVSKTKIKYPITIKNAIEKINKCYLECISYIFESIQNNDDFILKPQDHS